MKKQFYQIWIDYAVALGLLVIAWHAMYIFGTHPLIFPSLGDVGHALIGILNSERFWSAYGYTLTILVKSWIYACITIAIVVTVCSNFALARRVFEKYSSFFMPLPVLTLLPFVSLFFGFGMTTVHVLLVLSVVFSMSYQILQIFDNTKTTWDHHIKNLNFNTLQSLKHVYIPASIPSLGGVISMSWTHMWRVLITIEIAFGAIGGYFGIGGYLLNVRSTLDVAEMYAVLFMIAMTGMIVNSLIKRLSERTDW